MKITWRIVTLCIVGFVANSLFATRATAQYYTPTAAEVLLSAAYPIDAIRANDAATFALATTRQYFEGVPGQWPPQNNAADAFRHALWNATMKSKIGEEQAKAFADAHEDFPNNPPAEKQMDLANNAKGRTIIVIDSQGNIITDADLVALIVELALSGELAVIQGPDASQAMNEIISSQ